MQLFVTLHFQIYLLVNVVIPCKVPPFAWQHVDMDVLYSLPRLLAVLHSNGEGGAGMDLLEDWSNTMHTLEQVRYFLTRQISKALDGTSRTDQNI